MCNRLSRQCAEAILETQAEEPVTGIAPEEESPEGTVSLNQVLGMCGVRVGDKAVGMNVHAVFLYAVKTATWHWRILMRVFTM